MKERRRLVEATLQRSNITESDLVKAINRKAAGASQLVSPMEGVPTGGTIVIHVTTGSITPATVDAAMTKAKLGSFDYVNRIEITFIGRDSLQGPARRVVRAYRRTSAGPYELISQQCNPGFGGALHRVRAGVPGAAPARGRLSAALLRRGEEPG